MAGETNNLDEPRAVAETEWVIFGSSAIHGTGGFARRDIPAGTRLLEYVGEKISKAESLRRCEADNPFIFTLDDQTDVDGDVAANPARFLNHSCAPNCEAEVADGRIWIESLKFIPAGEEVTFNYGFDLDDYREYPCRCGAANCAGFIVAEEFFEHVHRQREVELAGKAQAGLPPITATNRSAS